MKKNYGPPSTDRGVQVRHLPPPPPRGGYPPLFFFCSSHSIERDWAELGVFLVDDALSPPTASSAARTTREVPDKLVDGDSVPIDLLSQFEAAVRPGPVAQDDAQLRKLTQQQRQTCDTLQAMEDALCSACQDLVHQRKLHDAATERLQSRIDDVQVQVTKLVQTLDRKRTTTEGAGAVDTRIQPAAKTLLSLARKLPPPRKLPPQGTQVPDAVQSALEKLRPPTTHGSTSIMRRGIRLCHFF